MISLTAEYGLRAAVYLAALENEANNSQTVEQIARGTQVPAGYLSKVLQQLSKAGVITSQRGIGGGFRLSRSASEISVFDVVQSLDSLGRIKTCPLGLEAHGTHLCPLHKKLDEAAEFLEKQFRETPLTALIDGPQALSELQGRNSVECQFPATEKTND